MTKTDFLDTANLTGGAAAAAASCGLPGSILDGTDLYSDLRGSDGEKKIDTPASGACGCAQHFPSPDPSPDMSSRCEQRTSLLAAAPSLRPSAPATHNSAV